jgi:hypothetical protein
MSDYKGLEPDDDLLAMERSTFQAHIGPEQAGVLLQLWQVGERADNNAFIKEFCSWMRDMPEPKEI